jgi:prepilin-type N-terminal cleavage/methylation domain-containing protein
VYRKIGYYPPFLFRSCRGFTLIELIAAMVVLVIALLGIATFLTSNMSGNANSRKATIASTFAEKKLEELKASGFTGATSANDTQSIDNVIYARTWTIATVTPDWLKKADIIVTWPPSGQVAISGK